ncbi:MAG: class I SAM-dependent methyltransferase [Salinibacter sp.]
MLKNGLLALAALLLVALGLFASPIIAQLGAPDDTEALLGAMAIKEGDWVADVGSGEGEYTLPMAKAVGDSGRAFAVDIDEDDLEELNEEIKDREIENVTTVSSVYDNPMLPRRSFDALLVRNAYHEFTAHEQMLDHLHAALKPGGRLVMGEYIDDEMVERDREAQVDDHDLAMRYAREELRQAGFKIVREVDTLRYLDRHDSRFWMMVATRPAADADA